jgi:hypothetical protein
MRDASQAVASDASSQIPTELANAMRGYTVTRYIGQRSRCLAYSLYNATDQTVSDGHAEVGIILTMEDGLWRVYGFHFIAEEYPSLRYCNSFL